VEVIHADPDNPTDLVRFRSRYLHLAGPFLIPVSEMMPVITGQRLGLMDDTGSSVIDHLHFSIHDTNIARPGSSFGGSVRPTPMGGVRLGDGDDGRCVESTNVERVPGLGFSPTVVSFGAVRVGQTRSRTLTVVNTTGMEVTISISASTTGPFRWPAVTRTIAHGGKTTLSAKFTPVNPGQTEKRIPVNSNAPGNPHSVRLTGRGVDEDL
jgi:murein DD-endopeptidase MepM/ murein hydrolase activator NlpD